jgi:hypothetical protein
MPEIDVFFFFFCIITPKQGHPHLITVRMEALQMAQPY